MAEIVLNQPRSRPLFAGAGMAQHVGVDAPKPGAGTHLANDVVHRLHNGICEAFIGRMQDELLAKMAPTFAGAASGMSENILNGALSY